MRTGIGYDIHRLSPTAEKHSLPLGGVCIPCFFKVEAHSDGDVLIHAIVDACLGALALGDIGQWFPDRKAENFRRPSSEFLENVISHVRKLGWTIYQMDSTVFLEQPRLSELSLQIRESLARLLQIELSNVSVKAKTFEGIGPIGERRAIAAQAIVTLQEL
jgi:2-C-methyl-D-erythritol 2,4-cyclodiphosphate synthase